MLCIPTKTISCQCYRKGEHFTQAQKESKSESELDEMWWKMAGELVAKYYAAREEVEKDVEGWFFFLLAGMEHVECWMISSKAPSQRYCTV